MSELKFHCRKCGRKVAVAYEKTLCCGVNAVFGSPPQEQTQAEPWTVEEPARKAALEYVNTYVMTEDVELFVAKLQPIIIRAINESLAQLREELRQSEAVCDFLCCDLEVRRRRDAYLAALQPATPNE